MYVFGDLLRQFRVRAGLTQQQLADELGVSRNALNAWETLKARPRLSRELIIRLGEILVLERDDLNQLLLALGYTLEPVEYSTQAKVVRHKAIETQYLKVTQQLELAPGVLLPQSGGRADCYQHVSLPVNYIERADILASVRTQVLATAAPVVLTSAVRGKPAALHGMGGIGKTVIARALCDESAVQEAFPDGILWATLGQTPNLLDQLRLWIEALGGRISENAPTVESLKRTLATLLKERTCLLILDDVWQHTHANAFRVDAPRCRLLLTTRDAEIARELGAQVQPIPLMTLADAIALLEEWADGHLAETDSALKEKLVKRLGYLPLAVKLAGAQLQRKDPEEWLRAFDVRKLKSKRPEDLHDSLEQTFLLSLDALDVLPRHLYLALAIFKEDEAAPQAAIEQLWQGLAGLDASTSSDLLDDLAVRALLDLALQGASRAARLHDLMREFIGTVLGEDGRLAAHRALLDAYRATCTEGGWHTAPDDGYLYDHLAYHLNASGVWDDLHGLFADQRWMEVRVPQRAYTYDGYLADLALAWNGAAAGLKWQIEADQEPSHIADCLRYMLIRTSINSLASNYVPELVAQAVETELWAPERALSIAVRVPDEKQQARMYTALLKTNRLTAAQREQAQHFGLEAALAISDVIFETRAKVLAALAPYVPAEQRSQAIQKTLDAALALRDEKQRAKALAALAPELPTEQRFQILQQVLEDTLAVPVDRFGDRWAEVLKALAPQLTGSLLQRALDAALILPDTVIGQRASVLEDLAPQLTGSLLQQALDAALAMPEDLVSSRVRVLTALAPQLSGPLLHRVLDAARVLPADKYGGRARLLEALAPRLTNSLLRRVLRAVLALPADTDGRRARALVTLARQLPLKQRPQALQQALEAALAVPDKASQARILATLAPQLPAEQRSQALQQALNAALAVPEERGHRAEVLATLAPQLTGSLLQQALDAALDMTGNELEGRARALAVLAPQLPAEQRSQALQQALNAALAVPEERGHRAEVLVTLAPHLTGSLFRQTLDVVLAMPVDAYGSRAKVLTALAPQLPAEQRFQALQQALDEALAMSNDGFERRAGVLAALVPQLTGPLLQQALDAVLAMHDDGLGGQTRVLAAFVSQLPAKQRSQTLQRALGVALFDTLARGADALGRRPRALAALAPQLPPEQRSWVLQRVVDMALAMPVDRYGYWREEVLAALAPQLTGPLLQRVLDDALAMSDDGLGGQARVLAALAPKLTGVSLQRALDATRMLEDERERATALAAFLSVAPDQVSLLKSIRQAILDEITSIQYRSREKMFGYYFSPDLYFSYFSPDLFRYPIFSPETLGAIVSQLIEICQEWQWL